MNITQLGKKILTSRSIRFSVTDRLGLYDKLSDEEYIKKAFKAKMGYPLDLENPVTYNEKLQWLKLNEHNPIYTTMVDKYLVKDYVAGIVGKEYVIPTLGVWESSNEIDFDSLPNQFVLKCTHDSGGIYICKNKDNLDLRAVKKLEKRLKKNYYLHGREWPYKNVKPRIIAEKYMTNGGDDEELSDYKIMTFNGEAKILFIATDRQDPTVSTKFDYFDMEGNHLDIDLWVYPNAKTPPPMPQHFAEMKMLAEKLSKDTVHSRVDFYESDGKVYFGEITFFHQSGFAHIEPASWDKTIGEWIEIKDLKR